MSDLVKKKLEDFPDRHGCEVNVAGGKEIQKSSG